MFGITYLGTNMFVKPLTHVHDNALVVLGFVHGQVSWNGLLYNPLPSFNRILDLSLVAQRADSLYSV